MPDTTPPPPVEQPVWFTVQGLRLSGTLHRPNGCPKALIVGCHGLQADQSSPKQIALAHRCTALGAAYFRFDHRGCGQSEGLFEADTTVETRSRDLVAAVAAARQAIGEDLPVGLFGSSLGGTVCLITASQLSPFAMVTLAAPVRSRSIEMPPDTPASLKSELFGHRLRFDITHTLSSIDHILIVHGSADETVGVDNAHWILQHANEPKETLILPDADHRISDAGHQQRFMQAAIQWFSDWMPGECGNSR